MSRFELSIKKLNACRNEDLLLKAMAMVARGAVSAVLSVAMLGGVALGQRPVAARSNIRIVEATEASGVSFVHSNGASGAHYIVETVVGGLALFDYNGDDLIDVYLLNDSALPGNDQEPPLSHALYRNNGNWTFTDVTADAGLTEASYGMGVAVADYDNDGALDVYVNNFGGNILYHNNGDGTFDRRTQAAGVTRGDTVGAGASFLDIDGDSDLDLYVAAYVDFNFANHIVKMIGAHQFHPGPADYRPVADTLYLNNGDGTFSDISHASGIADAAGYSMGLVAADVDDDRDVDVFVCNDGTANFLFVNDGKGQFTEQAIAMGAAFNAQGKAHSNMGVDWGDYDNDGLLDLITTSYQSEMPILFKNLGDGFFEDATRRARIDNAIYPHVKWGVGMVDFDNDADRDLFFASGHFMDHIAAIDDRTHVKTANFLLANRGNGQFANIGPEAGSGLAVLESSRGAGFDDLDNDGDVDIVILNVNAAPSLQRNESTSVGHWCQLNLVGTRTNRDGVGARVRVVTEAHTQTADRLSGRGYQSDYGHRLHFGLGSARQIKHVEVRWLGGDTERFVNVPIDRIVSLREGAGEPVSP